MKHLLFAIFQVICCTTLFASEPIKSALIFQKTTHDFGHIDEERGIVTCKFDGVNTSNSTIEVLKIATTCGCTTAKYSQKVVEAGENFSFEVTFNPLGRPGRIDKEIFLHVSDSPYEIKLGITGYVNARERTIYELYPFDMGGGLRMESNFHAFAYVEHGASVEERIAYINNSDHEISISIEEVEKSGALKLTHPERIAPHATGDITLCYALDESSDRYGTMSDIFRFVVDGKSSNVIFSTYAIAVDNFTLVEDILAPTAVISKKIVKFGEILCDNGTLEQSIEIGNSGESPLEIRAIESDSKAVTVTTEGVSSIAKGETMLLTIRLDTALIEDRDNPFVTRIRIICNDPMMPMQVIKVNAIPL
jgi:hypothetical protein